MKQTDTISVLDIIHNLAELRKASRSELSFTLCYKISRLAKIFMEELSRPNAAAGGRYSKSLTFHRRDIGEVVGFLSKHCRHVGFVVFEPTDPCMSAILRGMTWRYFVRIDVNVPLRTVLSSPQTAP